jgi:hypothetical protein
MVFARVDPSVWTGRATAGAPPLRGVPQAAQNCTPSAFEVPHILQVTAKRILLRGKHDSSIDTHGTIEPGSYFSTVTASID